MRKIKKLIVMLLIIASCISFAACAERGIGEEGMSKEEFDQIALGISMYRVDEIIGGDGYSIELLEETNEDTSDQYVTCYKYKYPGEKKGYAILTYKARANKNDVFERTGIRLTGKEAFDLK